MLLSRLKTFILFVLVVVSLFLSYAIWHGSWLVHTEVGLGESSSTQSVASAVPDLADVTGPRQIVLATGKSRSYSVDLPGSSDYQHLMSQLKTMTLSPLRSEGSFYPDETTADMIFDFAVKVNRVDLSTFIPALNTETITPPTQKVILFQQEQNSKVQLAIETGVETFVGTTNLSPSLFSHTIVSSVQNQPWHLLSKTPLTLVPQNPFPVKQYQCTTSQPKLSALVDSFFVNVQAVTRIPENKGTVIFTDGSRAVQWNSGNHQLVFDDPNAASSGPAQPTSLSGVLSYVRNHGGIPQTAMVSTDPSTSEENYIFRATVDGLPILNSIQQYRVLLQQGHIVEYDRPLTEVNQNLGTVNAQTISLTKLTSVLSKAGYSLAKVQITLGYMLQTQSGNTALLEPVYYIDRQGHHVATVDAVTGTLTKGGSTS